MAVAGFFSDPHFGHKNIIEYQNRPFQDVEEMTEAMIANYNRDVGPEDEVWWLGDAFFHSKNGIMESILSRMHGTKRLIRGNHDRDTTSRLLRAGFSTVADTDTITVAGVQCVLSHYPYANGTPDQRYLERRPKFVHPKAVLIHGHSHSIPANRVRSYPGPAIDVGVDAWGYGIAKMEDVEWLVREIV